MNTTVTLAGAFALALSVNAACSSDSTGGASSSGGAAGSSSGGAGAGGLGATGGTATGGTGGVGATGGAAGTPASGGQGGGGVTVNGCDSATAADHTADANVDIHFPGASPPWSFTPRCIRVAKGSTVTFIPDPGVTFYDHGVYGGTKVDGTAPPDPQSPITPKISQDSNPLVVQLPTPGAYGYYCPYHGYLGETGAIFVE